MNTSFRACASLRRCGRAFLPSRLLALPGLGLSLLLLGGCAAAPPIPLSGLDPADPHLPVRPALYSSALAKGSSRPVEALDWRDQNRRVTPEVTP